MKKPISISLIFDFPAVLAPYGFLDIGSDKGYFDEEETNIEFKSWMWSVGRIQLAELVVAAKRSPGLLVYFSGNFLQLLEQTDKKILKSIVSVVSSGDLEVIGGLYHPNLSSIYSERQFKRQVLRHQQLLKKLFGVTPTSFYNTENIYFQPLNKLISECGFSTVFAGAIDWYLHSDTKRRIFHDTNGMNVVLLDDHRSPSIFDEHVLAPCFLQLDTSLLQHYGGLSAVLRNVEAVAETVAITQQIAADRSKGSYPVKQPVSGSIHGDSLESLNGNVLQNQILKQYYQLEKKIEDSKNVVLLETWDQLGHVEYIRQMRTSVQNNQQYDAYVRLSNILSDLEIRLSR